MPDAIKVGVHIRELRKSKVMTQAQLAGCLKISYQSISKWEDGTSLPAKPMLEDIAEVFGSSVDFILKDEVEGISCQKPH